ncbi:MAG: TolC family protein [Bacteroidota bacterium]|nr:TolC family protein [Bacteroidota bacterium]MDP4195012.1 TolC family protein [Bacteroidota bacterium]
MRILGTKPDSTILPEQNIRIDSIDFSFNEAFERAIKNRCELKQAEISIAKAKLNKDEISGSFSPIFQFSVLYNRSSNIEKNLIQSLNLPNYGLNLSGSISIPLFDGGRISSGVEIAERNILVQENNYQQLKEDIWADLEIRYRTLVLFIKRLGALQLSLETAAEALNIAELRFRSGEITSSEIENVRNRYTLAKNSLDNAKISCVIQRAGLAKAMGEFFPWVESLRK